MTCFLLSNNIKVFQILIDFQVVSCDLNFSPLFSLKNLPPLKYPTSLQLGKKKDLHRKRSEVHKLFSPFLSLK